MPMVTYEILKSYIDCPYKSYLNLKGTIGRTSEIQKLDLESAEKARKAFFNNHGVSGSPSESLILNRDLLSENKPIITNVILDIPPFIIAIPAVELLHPKSLTLIDGYIPILVSPREKIDKLSRLLLAVICNLLNKLQENTPLSGRIVYGQEHRKSTISIEKYQQEAVECVSSLKEICSNPENIPRLTLNNHCQVCEYKEVCREKALHSDDLSLLRGITAKEIYKYEKRGIFSVKQLAYHFRPRKHKSCAGDEKRSKHLFELQARAIRDSKVYVYGTPKLPAGTTEIYLDVEGKPEPVEYYLIGILIVQGGKETRHSLWADNEFETHEIFDKFQAIVNKQINPVIFHYGSYEINFIRYFKKRLSAKKQKAVDEILSRCCNILSYLYSDIYLPTYSNDLKTVARFLGYSWSDENASGQLSIVWRNRWEESRNPELKQELLVYNQEDCGALLKVKEFLEKVVGDCAAPDIVHQEELIFSSKIGKFALPELKKLVKCSYFDYQSEKVHLSRPKGHDKTSPERKKPRIRLGRANATFRIKARSCRKCKSRGIQSRAEISKKIVDLRFINFGVRKWITRFLTKVYYCKSCKKRFLPKRYGQMRYHYGHNLKSWVIYQHIVNYQSFEQVTRNLRQLFGVKILPACAFSFKEYIASYYKTSYRRILARILISHVIYVDETPLKISDGTCYAWILTNGKEVVSIYRIDRSSSFLQKLLVNFRGVLVSDFYAAYDSFQCPQQKCLIHLIRDFNFALLRNPFDEELKLITTKFTKILQRIVACIDRYGLKKKQLIRYKPFVEVFFSDILKKKFKSETANGFQERLQKNKGKLFTFLNYDDVSWHNNNPEHAIKLMSLHHKRNIKMYERSRMESYLEIMSLYQSCHFQKIDFLRFMVSKEKFLDHYVEKLRG